MDPKDQLGQSLYFVANQGLAYSYQDDFIDFIQCIANSIDKSMKKQITDSKDGTKSGLTE